MNNGFLPMTKQNMLDRGWQEYDFLCITGDAYVDHPSFGFAIITRVLEAAGYRVAVLSQPDWRNVDAFKALGRPRIGAMVTGGNIDSMVAHYTVGKRRRSVDAYTAGGKMGMRPDRAAIVYCNRIKDAYPDLPVSLGGLEASLRRFAHYDYWDDAVRRSILLDSRADVLTYGMSENTIVALADWMAQGKALSELRNLRGITYFTKDMADCEFPYTVCPSFEQVTQDKKAYAKATRIQMNEQDPIRGKAIIQPHSGGFIVQTPPPTPLTTQEFDGVYELPYMRNYHPCYDKQGGVKAIEEVRFSIIHNRGCFGGCNFCSLAFHQGRMISVRSHESVVREAEMISKYPDFKGYIHDVGGPTANFRHTSCEQQKENGMCKRNCLTPEPCPNLNADHSDYLELLRKLRKIKGIKKVFVRSGIRFDYLMQDRSGEFFDELVQHHISGQLKVAPEHCCDSVLDYMAKPRFSVYESFREKYVRLNHRYGKEQYLVPYMISSHPGCTLKDAVRLTEYLNKMGHMPEQVQDFYPTPGTVSTCMYYTGIDPRTMKEVYVARDPKEKAMQRALLQWRKPEKRELVMQALRTAGREDLIGFDKRCLIKPDKKKEVKPKGAFDAKKSKAKKGAYEPKGRGKKRR